jgi:hypothetical protein
MQLGRLKRLSRRLLSQLEDLYIHEPDDWKKELGENVIPDEQEQLKRKRELKVVKSEKTKVKLEKWFREQGIPIRIVYNTQYIRDAWGKKPAISPIGKPGVITFYYGPVG